MNSLVSNRLLHRYPLIPSTLSPIHPFSPFCALLLSEFYAILQSYHVIIDLNLTFTFPKCSPKRWGAGVCVWRWLGEDPRPRGSNISPSIGLFDICDRLPSACNLCITTTIVSQQGSKPVKQSTVFLDSTGGFSTGGRSLVVSNLKPTYGK